MERIKKLHERYYSLMGESKDYRVYEDLLKHFDTKHPVRSLLIDMLTDLQIHKCDLLKENLRELKIYGEIDLLLNDIVKMLKEVN